MSEAVNISFAPARVTLTNVVQGDTLSFNVTLTDDAGDPVDVSGDTFDMDVKRLDASTVLSISSGFGITVTGPGVVHLEIPAASTALLDPDYTYKYDIQWTSGTVVRTIVAGQIVAEKQVTT